MTRNFDARGLKCPLPVLKARKIIRELAGGDVIVIDATDPGAPKDFAHFCDASGHRLLESTEPEPGLFRMRIEVSSS